MKKPLSTVVGSVLVTSASTTAACKTKEPPVTTNKSQPQKKTDDLRTQLDLTKIRVTGINVTSNPDQFNQYHLQIDIKNAYQKIIQTIIGGYNAGDFEDKPVLSAKDFKYGLEPNNKHPWAVAIMQSDKKTMIPEPTTANNYRNIITDKTIVTANQVLLEDNALEVRIKTTNNNVKENSVIAHVYLDKFVYTRANINKGLEITDNVQLSINDFKNVIDISELLEKKGLKYSTIFTSYEILRGVRRFVDSLRTEISTKVLEALNEQLIAETKTLDNWGVLQPTTAETIDFNNSDLILYKIHKGTISSMWHDDTAQLNDELYIGILNLKLNSYIHAPNAYLYLKIATVKHG